MALGGGVRTMHAQPIHRPGMHVGNVPVPNLIRIFWKGYTFKLRLSLAIEETDLDFRSIG
jgi:hypothetical protein